MTPLPIWIFGRIPPGGRVNVSPTNSSPSSSPGSLTLTLNGRGFTTGLMGSINPKPERKLEQMIFNTMPIKLFHFVAKASLGSALAKGLVILKLILDALDQNRRDNALEPLAKVVYSRLPKAWKSPDGPATEREFLAMVETGERFLMTIQQVTTR